MSFNDNARLDVSQVRGGGKGAMIGGGSVVAIVVALVVYFVTGDPQAATDAFNTDNITTAGSGETVDLSHCQTGADANEYPECLIVGTVNSTQSYWDEAYLATTGEPYVLATTVIFSGSTSTPCGTASTQTGPFYCPSDQQVYIDAGFFDELHNTYGADGGQLAQEYVVAHEYGHHIQNLQGTLSTYSGGGTGADSNSVRIELQADCYAGVWANHAATTTDENGVSLIEPLSRSDIDSALSAAAAVGDDHIQSELGGGNVNPDSWTHGSSDERERWFITGYESGDMNACDTFSTNDL